MAVTKRIWFRFCTQAVRLVRSLLSLKLSRSFEHSPPILPILHRFPD